MSKFDVAERLSQMEADAVAQIDAAAETVGRQQASVGMFKSGNHVLALQKQFDLIFEKTLANMADFALRTETPSAASNAVDRAARRLEAKISEHHARRLASISVWNAAQIQIYVIKYDASLRNRLHAVVTDTRLNVAGYIPGSRGLVAFFQRNAWLISLMSVGVSVASLYLNWSKE